MLLKTVMVLLKELSFTGTVSLLSSQHGSIVMNTNTLLVREKAKKAIEQYRELEEVFHQGSFDQDYVF